MSSKARRDLPTPGSPDDGRHLAVPLPRLLQRAAELLDLGVAAHEAGEPAGGGRLEPGAHGAGPGQLVDLDGLGQALHRPWARAA